MMCVGILADHVGGNITETRHLLPCQRLPQCTTVYRINSKTRIHSVKTEMKPCSSRISKLLQYHKFYNLGFCLFVLQVQCIIVKKEKIKAYIQLSSTVIYIYIHIYVHTIFYKYSKIDYITLILWSFINRCCGDLFVLEASDDRLTTRQNDKPNRRVVLLFVVTFL